MTTVVSAFPLFDPGDKMRKEEIAAWCIAKIIRIVSPVQHPKQDHL
jgi:hypothetical protein